MKSESELVAGMSEREKCYTQDDKDQPCQKSDGWLSEAEERADKLRAIIKKYGDKKDNAMHDLLSLAIEGGAIVAEERKAGKGFQQRIKKIFGKSVAWASGWHRIFKCQVWLRRYARIASYHFPGDNESTKPRLGVDRAHRFLGRLKTAMKSKGVWTLVAVEQFILDDLAQEAEDKETRKRRKEAAQAAKHKTPKSEDTASPPPPPPAPDPQMVQPDIFRQPPPPEQRVAHKLIDQASVAEALATDTEDDEALESEGVAIEQALRQQKPFQVGDKVYMVDHHRIIEYQVKKVVVVAGKTSYVVQHRWDKRAMRSDGTMTLDLAERLLRHKLQQDISISLYRIRELTQKLDGLPDIDHFVAQN